MKNIFSTLFVFGSVLVVILLGSFIFDKTGLMGSIHKADKTIEEGLKSVIDDEEEKIEKVINHELEKHNEQDNKSLIAIPDNLSHNEENKDGSTKEIENNQNNDIESNIDNYTDNKTENNVEKDII